MPITKTVLLLGSNMGDRRKNLSAAIKEINTMIDKVTMQSKIYETEPWGNTDQEKFYNMCVVIDTNKEAEEIFRRTLLIEKKLGRVRNALQYQPRIIDIDILFVGDTVINTHQLTIPHEQIPNRRFTLTPLAEIIPDFIHPVMNKSVLELWNDCTDTLACTPVGTL